MILICGGIGSGKSVVARILRLRGFGVFDCDSQARRLMECEENRHLVCSVLECDAFIEGVLDRKLVSEIIFFDSVKRKRLNQAVHALVKDEIKKWLAANPRNFFVETAIPMESGLYEMADEIWVVEAPDKERFERITARDGHNPEKIRKIMESQDREEELLLNCGKTLKMIPNSPSASLISSLLVAQSVDSESKPHFRSYYPPL